jgi:serine/threonine-protein kinase
VIQKAPPFPFPLKIEAHGTVILDGRKTGVPVHRPDSIASGNEDQPAREDDPPSTQDFGGSPAGGMPIPLGNATLGSAAWVRRPIISYAPRPPAPDENGPTLGGRYEIESVARHGTVADTYFARHRVLGKSVVIEVLRPEHANDPDIAGQFLGEARASSLARSPHLVDVLDFGKLGDGGLYSILERLDGVSLSSAAVQGSPFSQDRMLHVVGQVVEGLNAAHAAGLYHGDLAIDQVLLVTRDGEPDFVKLRGFNHAGSALDGLSLPASREALNPSRGRAPAQEPPPRSANFERGVQADIESVGAILYRLASGLDPLRGKDGEPIPLRALDRAPHVAAGIEAVMLKSLSRRGERRYGGMRDLAYDLEQVKAGSVPDALLEMIARSPSIVRAPPASERAPDTTPPVSAPVEPALPASRWSTYFAFTALFVLTGLTLGVLFHAWMGNR